jgi:uncharacterized surface anchored protein
VEGVKRAMVGVIGILFAAALLPFEAVACTYLPPIYKVGSNFVVHVASGDGLTFARVRVVLIRGTRVANSVRTDTQGVARFEAVEYGEYSLEIDELGIAGWDSAQLIVSNDPQATDIKLEWPSARILRVSAVEGTLLDSRNAKPLMNTSVELVHGVDGSLEARSRTGEMGNFELGNPEAGLYFLKIDTLRSGDLEPKGAIPILVVPGATRHIELAVGESSCGLLYSEACRRNSATISHVRGRLTDSEGAVINRAQIELFRVSGDAKAVETATPDKTGHFTIQNASPGEYQLRISSVGFAPLFVPLTVVPAQDSVRSIDVQLSVLGSSCADANVNQKTSRAD